MKQGNIVSILTGLVIFALPMSTNALAVVESRTGEPIVSSPEPAFAARFSEDHAADSYAERPAKIAMNAPAEDRAALLSLKQLETLKQEIGELRGLVETQAHEIQQLKKSQQDFYSDLDKRITQSHNAAPNKSISISKTTLTPAVTPAASAKKSSITIVPTGVSAAPTLPAEEDEETVEDVAESQTAELTVKTPTAAKKNDTDQKNEKVSYEAAYNLVRTKRYTEASTAFQDYLTRFKRGEHAANAHYWIGEICMVEWQKNPQNKVLLDKAAQAFSSVASEFPGNPKVSDALLKLGIVESEKGNAAAAQKYFADVKKRYPGTAAARIAETRLKEGVKSGQGQA